MDKQMIDFYSLRILNAKHCVAISGAGLSKACGIPTIQVEIDGKPLHVWFKKRTIVEDPSWYYGVYRMMLEEWLQANPNQAYLRLAEAGLPVITQNIDGLHKKAGTREVIELHGNLRELICEICQAIFPSSLALETKQIPKCPACEGNLRPNVVLEGEEVQHFSQAVDWVGNADVLLVIGTHLRMEPCDQLPGIVEANKGTVLFINKEAEQLLPQLLSKKEETLF